MQCMEESMSGMRRLLNRLTNRLLGEVTSDLRGLLIPRYQRDIVGSRRAALIINRVRLIAALFAVLTPLWIVLDVIFFPMEIWTMLAAGRLFVSVGFILLSLLYRSSDRIRDAYIAMGVMFFIPSVFFFFSHMVFSHNDITYTDLSVTFITGYAFLPFVMATGLSVFPLTALEGFVFAIPTLLVEGFVGQAFGSTLIPVQAHFGFFWLLVLVAAVAILAAMGQLHFLSEIVYKSSRDALTGAFNRHTGEEMLERYYLLAQRNRAPLSLVFLDLDDFKSINDKFGHDAGDRVLRNAANAIMNSIRREDLLIRWGGEEFVIVLPHTLERGCIEMNHRLSSNGLGLRPDGTALTASLGLAEVLKDKPISMTEFIDLADRRMYLAKQTGKNRICYGNSAEDFSPGVVYA